MTNFTRRAPGAHCKPPVRIGLTFGVRPERVTLTEAKKLDKQAKLEQARKQAAQC